MCIRDRPGWGLNPNRDVRLRMNIKSAWSSSFRKNQMACEHHGACSGCNMTATDEPKQVQFCFCSTVECRWFADEDEYHGYTKTHTHTRSHTYSRMLHHTPVPSLIHTNEALQQNGEGVSSTIRTDVASDLRGGGNLENLIFQRVWHVKNNNRTLPVNCLLNRF